MTKNRLIELIYAWVGILYGGILYLVWALLFIIISEMIGRLSVTSHYQTLSSQTGYWIFIGPIPVMVGFSEYLIARKFLSEKDKTSMLIGSKCILIGFILWLIICIIIDLANIDVLHTLIAQSLIVGLGYLFMLLTLLIMLIHQKIFKKPIALGNGTV